MASLAERRIVEIDEPSEPVSSKQTKHASPRPVSVEAVPDVSADEPEVVEAQVSHEAAEVEASAAEHADHAEASEAEVAEAAADLEVAEAELAGAEVIEAAEVADDETAEAESDEVEAEEIEAEEIEAIEAEALDVAEDDEDEDEDDDEDEAADDEVVDEADAEDEDADDEEVEGADVEEAAEVDDAVVAEAPADAGDAEPVEAVATAADETPAEPQETGKVEADAAPAEAAATAASRPEELRLLEALLFAASEPLDQSALAKRMPQGVNVKAALEQLQADYAMRGVNLVRVGNKWSFRTASDLSWLMTRETHETRKLSRAAVEVLAIIAYHQPVTRAEIEDIRGVVTSKGTIDVLLETGWIRPRGRRKTPGRPLTFGTTEAFLSQFSLEALGDLPGLEELKGTGLLDTRLPSGFSVPSPSDDPALREDEDPLEPGDLDLALAPAVEPEPEPAPEQVAEKPESGGEEG